MQFGSYEIGAHAPPFIIAEVSANHGGSLETALETILKAKECGAHAVKIQSYTADTMTLPFKTEAFQVETELWKGRNLYELYQEAETPFEWHEEIFNFAKAHDVLLFSTPFDETALALLEGLQAPGYKIASFELTDLPLIAAVAKTGKPTIISTGMATHQEIDEAISVFTQHSDADYAILHCISGYPAPTDAMNLRVIPEFIDRFQVPIGLSDHSMSNTAAIASVGLGAQIIEKHFVLDRNFDAADAEFSLDPAGLRELVVETELAWRALGSSEKPISDQEKESQRFRRSLYFACDMQAGEEITERHILRRRPKIGLSPKDLPKVVGRRLNCNVAYGDPVTLDMLT